MELLEKALIQGGGAVASAWSALVAFFSWLGGGLEAILQPVMGPLLGLLNPLCTVVADGVYAFLSPLPPWAGITIVSGITGVVMLLAFRYLSNQTGIARAKDDIKANLLALKLFKDDLRVAIRAQFRIMWALLRLQRYIVVPMLWMALPTMLLLSQMAMRYQWRPFEPGEVFLLRVHSPVAPDFARIVQLMPNSAVIVDVGPIADLDDVTWRLRAGDDGRHQIVLQAGLVPMEKELVIGAQQQRVSPIRPGRGWVQRLLYPVESAINSPPNSTIDGIEVQYPARISYLYGSDYWVLSFFVISMLTALLLKPLFKVRF